MPHMGIGISRRGMIDYPTPGDPSAFRESDPATRPPSPRSLGGVDIDAVSVVGETDESPREHFFYVSDDGDLTALRYDNWKLVFKEQRCPGTLKVWAEPFTDLRVPKIFNLRTDPYERADITSNTYYDWLLDHAFMAIPAQAYVAQMLQTFAEFPPRQKSASFNLDQGWPSCRRLPRATERLHGRLSTSSGSALYRGAAGSPYEDRMK
jgi:arylsulfatase-like protein